MKKILIIGSGVAGRDVYREIRNTPDLKMDVVGFVDDDITKQGDDVDGVTILGTGEELKELVEDNQIDEVVIAIPSAQGEAIANYVKKCSDLKIASRIVPRVKEIIEGKATLRTLRRVRIEDLLGRPVIKSDVKGLKKFFHGKTVMITGACGSIGSELSRQITAYDPQRIIFVDWWENGMFELNREISELYDEDVEYVIGNIRDKVKMNSIFDKYKPDYVFHAAAYKHVPLMEENPTEAVKNNIFGTKNIVDLSSEYGVEKFVLVSTDKAADPANVMGATKLFAESIAKSQNGKTKFIAVRFGNVLNSNGSVIPIFRDQIDRGGPVTVTDKRMTRFFMTIPEAVQLILKAGSMGKGGELYVLDMGTPVKITDLAENMIRLSGYIPYEDIDIVFTGIRPGEKIHERLFTDKEKLLDTNEKKIFVSKSSGIEFKKLDAYLSSLSDALKDKDDAETIRNILTEAIPSLKK